VDGNQIRNSTLVFVKLVRGNEARLAIIALVNLLDRPNVNQAGLVAANKVLAVNG